VSGFSGGLSVGALIGIIIAFVVVVAAIVIIIIVIVVVYKKICNIGEKVALKYCQIMSSDDELPTGLEQDVNLSDFEVGSLVQCKTKWGEVVKGFVYSIDAVGNRVILENGHDTSDFITPQFDAVYKLNKVGEHALRIINISALTEMGVIKSKGEINRLDNIRLRSELPYLDDEIDNKAIQYREHVNIDEIKSNLRKVGQVKDPFAQKLFNQLSSMYPNSSWDGNTMLVEGIRITPPYTEDQCEGQPTVMLERLQKMLTQYRIKSEFVDK
ncbi:MAG: hypothetical protein EZS28_009008, partial [Streblomastix strix]